MNEYRLDDYAKQNNSKRHPRNRVASFFKWCVSIALVVTSFFVIYEVHAYQSLSGTYEVVASEDERHASDGLTLHDNNVVTNFTPEIDWCEGKFHLKGDFVVFRLNGVRYNGYYNKEDKTLAVMIDGKIELFSKTARQNGKEL
ncbi:hypothetical protein G6R29_04310 [Fructobacillus sp. M2-14]|uniref:Uncharacterized protein n=1 Tax=Fructobacillus broussonetiae TaxID=2713173 RepID=A0ABS5R3W7_9LACO|nr:hypothetical protein [Fructobacillus broussonetiae]MBS9338847.1 hypothetical protein [Fructobacillus broussonetiae]